MPGWGLCPVGFPAPLAQEGSSSARTAEASSPPPTAASSPPSSPTRLHLQPPTSFCSFLWQLGNARTASLPPMYARGRPPSTWRLHHTGKCAHFTFTEMLADTQAHMATLDCGGNTAPASFLFPLKTLPPAIPTRHCKLHRSMHFPQVLKI